MSDDTVGRCWHCGRALGKADLGRETTCLGCGKDTRVCRNCRFYAPGRPDDCEEPMAERVMLKERANFCEYFQPTTEPVESAQEPSPDDLMKAAEDLFK